LRFASSILPKGGDDHRMAVLAQLLAQVSDGALRPPNSGQIEIADHKYSHRLTPFTLQRTTAPASYQCGPAEPGDAAACGHPVDAE